MRGEPGFGSPCIVVEFSGNEFICYALDAVQGRGNELARLKIKPDRKLPPDGSRLALLDAAGEDPKIWDRPR
jgi:hypothetical protein